jgi:hypothetical protein
MRAFLIVALGLSVAGCMLRLEVTRSEARATETERVNPVAVMADYRAALDSECAAGMLTHEACTEQEALVEEVEQAGESGRAARFAKLLRHADDQPHPAARARLLRMLRLTRLALGLSSR